MYQKQLNLFATVYLLYCLPLTKFESNFSDLSVIISIIQTYGATESLRSVLGQNLMSMEYDTIVVAPSAR